MNALPTVTEYIREDGSSPFRHWFESLTAQAAAKVATAILRIELGNMSRVKRLGNIAEYRIDWGPGYRIYLGQDGDELVILLGGGTKRRQQLDVGGIQGKEDGHEMAQDEEVKRWR